MEKKEYYKMFEFENHYWWYRGLHELVISYVDRLKKLKKNTPLNILDAGCGTGRMMELLVQYGTVEGIDFSEDALRLCKQRGLTMVQFGDLNTMKLPGNTYDVIISNDVIYHAMIEDDMAVVKKFHQSLKPDGIMILNLPAFNALKRQHDVAVFGKRRYNKKQTLEQLNDVGFLPIKATYRLPPLFFVMMLQKHLLAPFLDGDAQSDLKPLSENVNNALLGYHRMENRLISMGISFPLGSSLFLVCRKKKAEESNP
jgi:SAM-dependent methyltransferase